MVNLIKIWDVGCPVCERLEVADKMAKESFGLNLVKYTVEEVATSKSKLRSYVAKYFVDERGDIDIPIYIIMNDGVIERASIITEPYELTEMLQSWEITMKSTLFD